VDFLRQVYSRTPATHQHYRVASATYMGFGSWHLEKPEYLRGLGFFDIAGGAYRIEDDSSSPDMWYSVKEVHSKDRDDFSTEYIQGRCALVGYNPCS